MSQRVQKQKTSSKTEQKVEEAPAKTDNKQELKDEIDDLLEEIDGLLEENAEEFVKNYIQKGDNDPFPSGGQSGMLEAWKKYAPPALNYSPPINFMPTGVSRMV